MAAQVSFDQLDKDQIKSVGVLIEFLWYPNFLNFNFISTFSVPRFPAFL